MSSHPTSKDHYGRNSKDMIHRTPFLQKKITNQVVYPHPQKMTEIDNATETRKMNIF